MTFTITDPEGATDITGYKISNKLTSASGAWATKDFVSKTGEITGLTNDSEYQFKAQASNNKGFGEFSKVVSATPKEIV